LLSSPNEGIVTSIPHLNKHGKDLSYHSKPYVSRLEIFP
jgi:hypothetical protein